MWLSRLCVPLFAASFSASLAAQQPLLSPDSFAHYVQTFEADEQAATGHVYNGEPDGATAPESAWSWMKREIPLFESSDKQFEDMYYFRWYAWKKHLVHTPSGYLITEWLPRPGLPNFDALPDAAPFHLGEARWLHTNAIAEDDARFWYRSVPNSESKIRSYSAPMATAVRDVTLADGDSHLLTELLPSLARVYHEWESTQQDSNGLFWSIDTRDAMEKSISGDGYRPTLNSYMVSDARAIASAARLAGQPEMAKQFDAKATTLNGLIESKLWNRRDQFYEVVSPGQDSSIRAQKKFVDPGTTLQFSGVRELIGYLPWSFSSPAPEHGVEWRQLFAAQGFDGQFGATTAERRSPRFRFVSSDQCTWNGPAWPFAETQTLNALAAYLNASQTPEIASADYYRFFSRYVLAQHIALPDGRRIDWIDEDYDADTDEWIAKRMLIQKNKQVGRGNYYNHSGFADPLITGLIGLHPREDNHLELRPLLPAAQWSYFAMDALPYHGHRLTIAWDSTGNRYHRGKGLWLAVDGTIVAHRPTLGPLSAELPANTQP